MRHNPRAAGRHCSPARTPTRHMRSYNSKNTPFPCAPQKATGEWQPVRKTAQAAGSPVVCVLGLPVKDRWASPLWSAPRPCPYRERCWRTGRDARSHLLAPARNEYTQEAFPDTHDQSQWLRIPCHTGGVCGRVPCHDLKAHASLEHKPFRTRAPAMKMPRHRLHPVPSRAYVLSVAGGSGVQAGPVPTRAASVALSEYAKMFAESCVHAHSVCSIRHGCEVREVLCPCAASAGKSGVWRDCSLRRHARSVCPESRERIETPAQSCV